MRRDTVPVAGAIYNVFTGASSSTGQVGGDLTTGANGTVCIDNLAFGDYTVHEKTAPTGYAKGPDVNVTIIANGTCTTGAQVTANVTDTPLTNLSVTTTGQVTGATASTIACRDSGNNVVGTDVVNPTVNASSSVTNLKPGTYTCTVVIDP